MAGISRETQISIEASSMFPGFRFSPTDVELISYYLKKKVEGLEKCVEAISEVEICKYEPWDLPAKSFIQSENEWFFFCARGRKYPNGSQSKRATELGYWKATGKERNVKSGDDVIGTKRTLVFHIGRAPKGERTEWIMHEYCMEGRSQDSLVICRLRKNREFHLNNTSNRNYGRMHNRNHAGSEGGTDQAGMCEGDKAVESCSKKCSSSHDSYSIEQIDSASESEQKLADDVNVTESSTQNQDSDGEDDFFAEILKDDIIKLDEASLSATSVAVNTNPEAATTSQQHVEAVPFQAVPFQGLQHIEAVPFQAVPLQGSQHIEAVPFQVVPLQGSQHAEAVPFQAAPFQGTANRRIKLRKQKPGPSRFNEHSGDITKSEPGPPKCLLTLVFCVLILLAVFLYMCCGFWPLKASSYATLSKDFWQ